jgi:hypothetical protein
MHYDPYSLEQRHIRRPSDVFHTCPSCLSTNLMKFEGEAFCTSCKWNSIAIHEECKRIRARNESSFNKGGRA